MTNFKWVNNKKLGSNRKKLRNLKLKIGNNKDFEDLEAVFKKLEPINTLKIHWLNLKGSKFMVFMKQLSKEVDL